MSTPRATIVRAFDELFETSGAASFAKIDEATLLSEIPAGEHDIDSVDILEMVLVVEEQFDCFLDLDTIDADWETYTWGQFLADLERAIDDASA